MPLSQLEMMVEEQVRFEANQMTTLVNVVRVAMHGDAKDVKSLMAQLTGK